WGSRRSSVLAASIGRRVCATGESPRPHPHPNPPPLFAGEGIFVAMDYATTETGRSAKPILGGAIGARAIMDAREVIVLGSNNYLGLANHPEVIARAKEALEKYGAGPALNPPLATTPIHEALCEALAKFHRTESALLFNSCTSANVAVACTLAGA